MKINIRNKLKVAMKFFGKFFLYITIKNFKYEYIYKIFLFFIIIFLYIIRNGGLLERERRNIFFREILILDK